MKVILLQDVARLGRRYDVVNVPDGHARNLLLPRGLALAATQDSLKKIESMKAKRESQRADADSAFSELCAKLSGAKLLISAAANEKGHLFKAVSTADIAEAIGTLHGHVDASQIVLTEPVKATGDHMVTLESGEVRCTFTVTVEAQ